MSRPELVVFDLAGTTVYDGDAVRASFLAALAAAGLRVEPESVKEVMGRAKPEAIRLLLERAGADASPEAVRPIHTDFVARMIRHYRESPAVREVPGTTDTFRALRAAGIHVAVNTGFSREIVSVLLERMGWEAAGLLDASVTSDEVPRGRPHPDMIRHLMAALGVADSRGVAKVGDTPTDLLEGQSAGCGWVIGVTQGTHTREQLAPHPHTHLIPSVVGLPALLGL
jgi:phosphonatase-like hydrolase